MRRFLHILICTIAALLSLSIVSIKSKPAVALKSFSGTEIPAKNYAFSPVDISHSTGIITENYHTFSVPQLTKTHKNQEFQTFSLLLYAERNLFLNILRNYTTTYNTIVFFHSFD
ncbi:MAG TPA: hypothetical protein PKV50_06475, partial [Prolixibacteraceae bacterium]|nr:hypothetical protein [Prolixibacteraceae bacterium]